MSAKEISKETIQNFVSARKKYLIDKIATCKETVNDFKRYEMGLSNLSPIRQPKLVIIRVGESPQTDSYIKGKIKDCYDVGINAEVIHFHYVVASIELILKELKKTCERLNNDINVDGIIIQLPVGPNIKLDLSDYISPEKDVDGFTKDSNFKPCTPLGIINFLRLCKLDLCGKNAVVIGRSDIVGKPLAKMLLDANATVTVCHSKTPREDMFDAIDNADLVFTCTNINGLFTNEDLPHFYNKEAIIDVGLGKDADGKLCGNFTRSAVDEFFEKGGKNLISGTKGVGLLTRIALMHNVVKSYENGYINAMMKKPSVSDIYRKGV